MARIRKIEIANFRGIQLLAWCPTPGINCLIGPGDSGKSVSAPRTPFLRSSV